MPPAADVIGSVTCSKFVFAGMVTELAVARAFTDRGIAAYCDGMLSTQAPGRCWTSTGAAEVTVHGKGSRDESLRPGSR